MKEGDFIEIDNVSQQDKKKCGMKGNILPKTNQLLLSFDVL